MVVEFASKQSVLVYEINPLWGNLMQAGEHSADCWAKQQRIGSCTDQTQGLLEQSRTSHFSALHPISIRDVPIASEINERGVQ